MSVREYHVGEQNNLTHRLAYYSTVLIHLFQGYFSEICPCKSSKSECSCSWDSLFRTIRQNGISHDSLSEKKIQDIQNFTMNFSPPREGEDLSGITLLQEHRVETIPNTHLLNRPFMIERGLDAHPSSSPAWLGGNCNELTSLYKTLTEENLATESPKVFDQFAKQLTVYRSFKAANATN